MAGPMRLPLPRERKPVVHRARIAQDGRMSTNLDAAIAFMASHALTVDRRRLDLLLGDDDAAGVLGALDAHRNADGGYGWALEPDLRSPESQPAAAMHAFEVMADVAPATTPRATELCAWLAQHTIGATGLPFALPQRTSAGSAPWWQDADGATPSLHITTAVLVKAHDVARHDDAVARHPWLASATAWCFDRISELTEPTSHELLFSLQLVDAAASRHPEALAVLEGLAPHGLADGEGAVPGGTEVGPFPPLAVAAVGHRPARGLVAGQVGPVDLDRGGAGQRSAGGWEVSFRSASPIGALEW